EVDGAPAQVADQVVVLFLAEVDDAGPVPQVDVVDDPRLLEGVHGPVDGRQVDAPTEHLLRPLLELRHGHVPEVGLGEDGTYRLPGGGDAHPLPAQCFDQRPACHHEAEATGATVPPVPAGGEAS